MPPLARLALGRTAGLVGATVDEAPQLPVEPLSEAVNRRDRVEVGDLRPDHRAIQVDLALGPGGAFDPRVRFLDEHHSSTEDRDVDESVERPDLLLCVLARLTRDVASHRHVYLNHHSAYLLTSSLLSLASIEQARRPIATVSAAGWLTTRVSPSATGTSLRRRVSVVATTDRIAENGCFRDLPVH